MASIQKDGGFYKGVRWTLAWTTDGARHTVKLTEDGQAKDIYSGEQHNDAKSAFIASQGEHFDEDANRRRGGR